MREIHVGLIGLGTVGCGMIKILDENRDIIEDRLGASLVLKRIVDIDTTSERPVDFDRAILTTDISAIMDDPEIEIVVELIGGYEPAKSFILEAIGRGKHVVTANKALLAVHGQEIFDAAHKRKVAVAFEASVGGGIPLIKSIREGLAANRIASLYGILNGTSNYVLTRMTDEGATFEEALEEAQAKGYAEADPTFDVDGTDTAHKLAVAARLAYCSSLKYEDIYTEGISQIEPTDIRFASEMGYVIKLLAVSRNLGERVEARVHPTMIPKSHVLASVKGVFNAVFITGDSVGDLMLYGHGAGMMAAGSAVVADLMDLARDTLSGVPQRVPFYTCQPAAIKDKSVFPMEDVRTCYYFRFSALDQPGVLSKIAGILGGHDISISAVIQKGRQVKGFVPIVMLTHEAREKDVRDALAEINKLKIVGAPTRFIRVEAADDADGYWV